MCHKRTCNAGQDESGILENNEEKSKHGDQASCGGGAFADRIGRIIRYGAGPSRISELSLHYTSQGNGERRSSGNARQCVAIAHRSEEHTSELQSLMRSSYAVLCLTKKKPHQ